MNYDDIDQTESSNSNIFLELMLEENWLAAKEFLKNSTVEFSMFYKEIGETALDFAIEQVFEIENDEKFDEIKQLIESLFERGDSISYNRQYFGTNSLHILLYHDFSIKYQIEILKILLQHTSSKEINCYDVFGKTPLLEAIEKRNEEAAIELLKHPEIDPNLFKIECEKEFTHCSETIRTGTSTLEAARISVLSKVAELIQNHPKYNPNSRYVNLTSDVLYRYFDHYAACGNVDTLKTFLQQVDLKDFLTPDTVSGWTVLHIACFSGNLEVIGFLLNKEALEKASGQEISEKDFKEFINCRDGAQGVALGRALHASRKFPEQAKLFINCPQFDPNKILTFPSRVLLHNLLEMDQKDLIIELAKRKDFEIDLRDGSKNTAIRIACDTDNVEMVKLLIGIGEMNGIDTRELNKGEAPVMKYLNNYSEETWFGEKTSQILFPETEEELTVNDLYRIYENGDPLNVLVSYKKYFCASEIEFINGEDEVIKQHLIWALEELYNNYMDVMPLALDRDCYPKGCDEILMEEIFTELDGLDIDELIKAKESAEICIRGINLKFTISSEYTEETHQVEEHRIIDLENLNIPEKFDRDDPEKFAAGKYQEYTPLLNPIAERYIRAKETADLKKSSDLLEIFRALVFSSNTRISIGINELVQGTPELEEILQESQVQGLQTLSLQDSNATDPFSKILINRIFLANLSRRFIKRKEEVVNRRFDSLSRIIFGDSRCSAACFDGETILLSTNILTTSELIEETMNYFADVIAGSASEDRRFQLVYRSTANLIINESKKSSEEIKEALNNLVRIIYDGFGAIKDKLEFDEDGMLKNESFKALEELEGFAGMLKTLENLNFKEGYIKNSIKYAFRGIKDVTKIERSIQGNDSEKSFDQNLVKAFREKNYLYLNQSHPQIDDGVHAEMRIVDYLLSKGDLEEKQYYIGLSKLCCAHCNLILSNMPSFSIDFESFTRGKHTEIFTWPVPNFLQQEERFLEIFRNDKPLCDAFKSAIDPIKSIKDCFNQESLPIKILRGKMGKRTNQDLDLSTSIPTTIAARKFAREMPQYLLSDEERDDLLKTIEEKRVQEALNINLRKSVSTKLKSGADIDLSEYPNLSKRFKKDFPAKSRKFFKILKLEEELKLYPSIETLKVEMENMEFDDRVKSGIKDENDLEKLQKIIRDEKIERQKIFEIDIDKISITKVTEKVDVLRCCTDMKKVLHYDGLKSVILPEKFDEYISILGFNEQEQESWKRAYKLVNEQVRLNESSEEKLMETSSEVSEHETFINPEELSIDFSDTCSIGEKFETTKPPSPSPKPKRQQQVEATKLATDPHPKRFKKL